MAQGFTKPRVVIVDEEGEEVTVVDENSRQMISVDADKLNKSMRDLVDLMTDIKGLLEHIKDEIDAG